MKNIVFSLTFLSSIFFVSCFFSNDVDVPTTVYDGSDTQVAQCTGLPENAHWNTATNINQTWTDSEWVPSSTGNYNITEGTETCNFICNDNYTWNDSNACNANTRAANCSGLPSNASWNTASSITQTWSGSAWTPSMTGNYNTTASTTTCVFTCNSGYYRDGNSTCSPSTQTASCTGLPTHAEWNTASSITQTWGGSAWSPSATGTYSTTASTTECRYKCQTGATRISDECQDVTAPTAGNSGTISFTPRYTSVVLSWTTASDGITSASNLQYKVVRSDSTSSIDTISEADAISGSDLVSDWNSNLLTTRATGLTYNSNHYFNILVKDEAGNKTLYSPASAYTTASPEFLAKLAASDRAVGDWLGASVAVSADGSTIVAGAYYGEGHITNSGAVYVFERGSGWSNRNETAKLLASDGGTNDYFGDSVAISADGSTIVVGAHLDDNGGSDSGSVYVFEKGAGWTSRNENYAFRASDPAEYDHFGRSVSVSSDGSTIVIGAPQDSDVINGSGSVYVFVKGSGWSSRNENYKLHASDPLTGSLLGNSVAISTDGSTIVAGAHEDDTLGDRSGAAYVFVKGAGWSSRNQNAKILDPKGNSTDYFGESVDVSSDGSSIVVGSKYASLGGTGTVLVYERGAEWTNTNSASTYIPTDGMVTDQFGNSVSISSDGSSFLAAADYAHWNGWDDRGKVYLFHKGGGWSSGNENIKFVAPDPGEYDYFGSGVDISGDSSTLVIGRRGDNYPASDTGSVYVYE